MHVYDNFRCSRVKSARTFCVGFVPLCYANMQIVFYY